MKYVRTGLILLTMLLATVAVAAAAGNRAQTFTLSPVIGGYSFDGVQHQQTRPVYGIRGGYNFTRHLGVEALFDYVQSVGTLPRNGDVHVYRYGGDLLYHFFPGNRLVPYIAAGYSAITTDYENQTLAGEYHFHHTKGVGDYGPGFKYFLSDNLAIRGDFRHLLFSDGDVLSNYEYTVGLTFHFGGEKPASPVAAVVPQAAPVPKQLQPTPPAAEVMPEEAPLQPVPAAEPAPGHEKYCVTLHTQFEIDSDAIMPESYGELARVGDFMKAYPTTTAVIEGHTDNVGSFDHNMKLSEERAASVARYLSEHFGIASSRFHVKGYGSTRPVADNLTPEGRMKNRRIEAIVDCVTDVKEAKLPNRLCVSLNIEFPTGQADILPRYYDEIARVGEYMQKYPTTTAVIEGHTDNVGGYDYNMKLSQRRAESVVDYLVEHFGIARSRLTAEGYGYTRRIAYNNTPEGRQKNRRVNAIIDCVIRK